MMVTRMNILRLFLTMSLMGILGLTMASGEDTDIDKQLGLTPPSNLITPLKDTGYYLEAFIRGTNDSEVLAVAKKMGWDTLKTLAENVTFVENLKKESCGNGKKRLADTLSLVKKLKEKGVVLNQDDAAYRHQAGFQQTSNTSMEIAKVGLVTERATRLFKSKAAVSNKAVTGLKILKSVDACLKKAGRTEEATRQTSCNSVYPYRTMDGSCNNLNNVLQGAAFGSFRRMLFPDYADGVSAPRRDSKGNVLPSARLVSIAINRLPNVESPTRSLLHMTYGQFQDHDFTSTPITRFSGVTPLGSDNQPISCCDPSFTQVEGTFSNELGCFPIRIPADDPFYATFKKDCMEFKRSAPASTGFMGPREQINEQSSYIDGSQIYGIKPPTKNNDTLRTLTNGLLKVQDGNLLPPNTITNKGCNTPEQMSIGQFCFTAGDGRVNEQTWLTFFQTVWAREHNRIAAILKSYRPTYTDEQLYQESRRIVIAELQHVTYNEYLPTILPSSEMSVFWSQQGTGQTNHYNPGIDATIANSFAAAIFRFGHSEVGDFHYRVNSSGATETLEFSSTFFNPFYLYVPGAMGNLARGSMFFNTRKADAYFTKEVSGKLFRGSKPFGLDLVALNIQRGRDHGIPGYTKWLQYCGKTITTFNDLTSVMTSDSAMALASVYTDVGDIDLFAGGMSEFPVQPDGFLGFTFTCLLKDQFIRLKFGDRFWYEEANQAGKFLPDQIAQLHQVSLARIMCNNIPELESIQRYPLQNPGPNNPSYYCNSSSIPYYDLSPWA